MISFPTTRRIMGSQNWWGLEIQKNPAKNRVIHPSFSEGLTAASWGTVVFSVLGNFFGGYLYRYISYQTKTKLEMRNPFPGCNRRVFYWRSLVAFKNVAIVVVTSNLGRGTTQNKTFKGLKSQIKFRRKTAIAFEAPST